MKSESLYNNNNNNNKNIDNMYSICYNILYIKKEQEALIWKHNIVPFPNAELLKEKYTSLSGTFYSENFSQQFSTFAKLRLK